MGIGVFEPNDWNLGNFSYFPKSNIQVYLALLRQFFEFNSAVQRHYRDMIKHNDEQLGIF